MTTIPFPALLGLPLTLIAGPLVAYNTLMLAAVVLATASSGGTTIPVRYRSMSAAADPFGGTQARIGRPAGRYSNTFPDGTLSPRSPISGSRSRSRSTSLSRCSSSARARDT
jgi:hypothetical protein